MRVSPRAPAAARARSAWPRRRTESATRRAASERGKNPSPGSLTVPIGTPNASRSASAATASPRTTAPISRVIVRLLLRGGDDAAEGGPLLPPGRLELLARLELDVVAELSDLLQELLVLGDLPEGALELGPSPRPQPPRADRRAPPREDPGHAL